MRRKTSQENTREMVGLITGPSEGQARVGQESTGMKGQGDTGVGAGGREQEKFRVGVG